MEILKTLEGRHPSEAMDDIKIRHDRNDIEQAVAEFTVDDRQTLIQCLSKKF